MLLIADYSVVLRRREMSDTVVFGNALGDPGGVPEELPKKLLNNSYSGSYIPGLASTVKRYGFRPYASKPSGLLLDDDASDPFDEDDDDVVLE